MKCVNITNILVEDYNITNLLVEDYNITMSVTIYTKYLCLTIELIMIFVGQFFSNLPLPHRHIRKGRVKGGRGCLRGNAEEGSVRH